MNPEIMIETEVDTDKMTDTIMKMLALGTTQVQVEGKVKGIEQKDLEFQDQIAGAATTEASTETHLGIAIAMDIGMIEDQTEV